MRRAAPLRFALLALLAGCDADAPAPDPLQAQLDAVRAATARYQDFAAAQADGYTVDATGYRTGMGHHFLNPALLDGTFEAERPELLMYVPVHGGMVLVGVEYATPAGLASPPPAPEGFAGAADVWVINEEFGLWTLHLWNWLENPDGRFAPMNPRLP